MLKGAVRVLVSSLIIVAVGLFLFARYAERTSIFFPDKELKVRPETLGLDFDDVHFKTTDGVKLHGWFLRSRPPSATVVLYLHGNAGNIGDRLAKISLLLQMGLNVFLFDYRGYGLSEGSPSEKGLYLDALAAYDLLAQRSGVDARRIVVYGASLGGVPAAELCAKRSPAAVLIDSSFPSAAAMARRMYPFIPSFLVSVKMDSAQKLARSQVPKLFLHSPEDEMIPYSLGRDLFAAAADPKEFLDTHGQHNDNYIESRDLWYNGIREFLARYQLL
jgi:uncharacterized protein